MKTKKNLPNFTTLHRSEQKSIRDIISLLFFFFFLASICGFLWEVLLFIIKDGQFRNRGFLYGPWLPVYGIGAVLFYLLLAAGAKGHLIRTFFLSALLGSSIELLIGWQLDYIWGLHYWDYTNSFLNFHGYICFASALGFGFAGMLWLCFFSAPLSRLWFHIPESIRKGANTILLLLFVADCAAALIWPNAGNGITFP